jgi:hypothetical protein
MPVTVLEVDHFSGHREDLAHYAVSRRCDRPDTLSIRKVILPAPKACAFATLRENDSNVRHLTLSLGVLASVVDAGQEASIRRMRKLAKPNRLPT